MTIPPLPGGPVRFLWLPARIPANLFGLPERASANLLWLPANAPGPAIRFFGMLARLLWLLLRLLWLLLRIVLFVFLGLLALLLLLLCLPLRYEATGQAKETGGLKGLELHAKADALLGLAAFRAILKEGDLLFSFKLFGKTIKKGAKRGLFPDQNQDEPPADEPSPSESASASADKPSPSEPADKPSPSGGRWPRSGRMRGAPEPDIPFEESPVVPEPDIPFEAPPVDPEPTVSFETPPRESLPDRLEALLQKAESLRDRLEEPATIKTLARLKKAAGKLLRHILPRELKVKAIEGTGDPASTGWILALFYAALPLYPEAWDLSLKGDFEKTRLQGKLYVKGKIVPICLIGIALGLLADKNIRGEIWKRLRKNKKKKQTGHTTQTDQK